jgi:general secretion pathway protein D
MFLLLLLLAGCTKKVTKLDEDLEIPKPVAPRVPKKKGLPLSWKKKVSVSISKTMSIKELMNKLSAEAKLHIDLSQVEDLNGISYSAHQTEVIKVIKAVCRMCKWRLEVENGSGIKVLPDTQYLYSHEVAFLSNLRRMKSSSSINIINQSEGHDAGISLESENTLNLWKEIEDNLLFILDKDQNRYSINKQAGLVLVNATQAEHEKIATFLESVHERISAQVLIEAKIVEVVLNKKHKNGIDWGLLDIYNAADSGKGPDIFRSFTEGMTFLAHFGETRTLANPRAVVLNNQHAVFKVVRHNVYYKISSNTILNEKQKEKTKPFNNYGSVAVNTNANIIQTGIVLIVHPSINFSDSTITVSIRPMVSDAEKIAPDPAIAILGGNTSETTGMPVILEKSIDTVVRVYDGETIILGGLTDANLNAGTVGFKKGRLILETASGEKRETVMVIKVQRIQNPCWRNAQLKDIGIKDLE